MRWVRAREGRSGEPVAALLVRPRTCYSRRSARSERRSFILLRSSRALPAWDTMRASGEAPCPQAGRFPGIMRERIRCGNDRRRTGGPGVAAPALQTMSELSRRRWRVLVIASIGVFLATLDSSILAVALPVVSSDLQLTFSEALWVQTSYLLVVTVLLIPVGALGREARPLLRLLARQPVVRSLLDRRRPCR